MSPNSWSSSVFLKPGKHSRIIVPTRFQYDPPVWRNEDVELQALHKVEIQRQLFNAWKWQSIIKSLTIKRSGCPQEASRGSGLSFMQSMPCDFGLCEMDALTTLSVCNAQAGHKSSLSEFTIQCNLPKLSRHSDKRQTRSGLIQKTRVHATVLLEVQSVRSCGRLVILGWGSCHKCLDQNGSCWKSLLVWFRASKQTGKGVNQFLGAESPSQIFGNPQTGPLSTFEIGNLYRQSTLQTSHFTFCLLAKVWDAHLLPSLQRGQNGRVCYLCKSAYWSRTFAPRHRTSMLTAIAEEDQKEIREYGKRGIFNPSGVMFTGDVWLKICDVMRPTNCVGGHQLQ